MHFLFRLPSVVMLLAFGFIATAGYFRATHNSGSTSTAQNYLTTAYSVPGVILDLQAPRRAVVEGSFTYNGPGGTFVQRFLGVFDSEASCDAYIRGTSGRFQTPSALYLKGTKLNRALSGRLTIAAYKGPGPYTAAQVEGDIGARDGLGTTLGDLQTGARSTFILQTRPDGSGTVTYTGPDANNAAGQTISGVMSWICSDQQIDLNAYSMTPY